MRVLGVLAVLLCAASALPLKGVVPDLAFNANGNFKILQIADIHYSTPGKGTPENSCRDISPEQQLYPCNDQNSTDLISRVLDAEKPDFVVFTGDNIDGKSSDAESSEWLVMEPVISRGIPFAVVFGNHDEEANLNRSELMNVVVEMPHTLAARGPQFLFGPPENPAMKEHVGNYYLTLKGLNGVPAFNFYFVDSGDYSSWDEQPYDVEGYDWVWESQIDWFKSTAATLKAQQNKAIPALAFFHIPIPEYDSALQFANISGQHQESICSPEINSGFFQTMLSSSVVASFVGHDHLNDYCVLHHNINLCYGGGGGYSGYGDPNTPRRLRVIELRDFGAEVHTWKRLHDEQLTTVDAEQLYPAVVPERTNKGVSGGGEYRFQSKPVKRSWRAQRKH